MNSTRLPEITWLILGWIAAAAILVVERVVGLPAVFLVIWFVLASQVTPRWALVQAVGVSLALAAAFGITWPWAFLIVWLGYLVVTWRRPTPATRWWRLLLWALGGAWLVGGLVMATQHIQLSWWAWWWPVVSLGALAMLKWRRHV